MIERQQNSKKTLLSQHLNEANCTINLRAVVPKSYSVHNALKLAPQVDTTDRSLVVNGQRGQFDSHVSHDSATIALDRVNARLVAPCDCYNIDARGV